jgi:hypothetical protein
MKVLMTEVKVIEKDFLVIASPRIFPCYEPTSPSLKGGGPIEHESAADCATSVQVSDKRHATRLT